MGQVTWKGVLFCGAMKGKDTENPGREVKAFLERVGHPTQMTLRNSGKCRYLRVGTKGYNFPYTLRVYAGGKEIFSQRIGKKNWSDLKIDLGGAAGKDGPVILEFYIPPKQKSWEGVWMDYADFFD